MIAAIAPRFERPEIERYIRYDCDLPDGGCIDLGLEEREGFSDEQTAASARALEYCVEKALDFEPGQFISAKRIALRLESLLIEWFPDRYWFAEVWTPSGIVKRYQVIQPAVVGGFRR